MHIVKGTETLTGCTNITNLFTQKKQVFWQAWFKEPSCSLSFIPLAMPPPLLILLAPLWAIYMVEDHCAYAVILRPQFSPTCPLFTSTWFIVKVEQTAGRM